MPTIMLRLQSDLVARIREHGTALGALGDQACVLTLINYAITQRESRSAGGRAGAMSMTPEERSARARHAVSVREARRTLT